MQNKPNSRNAQMNESDCLTRLYKNFPQLRCGKNKANFKPNCTLCEFFLAFTFLCSIYNLTMQTWTIQKLLNWTTEHFTGRSIDSPRLSAELLLSHVLGMQRIELYTHFDNVVGKEQLDRLHDLVKRAAEYEPVAYLTGKTEFYSLELNITPDCLIPRPETELLVEKAIQFLRNRSGTQMVCDLCTGSGCVAVAIARNFDGADIIATDISDAALGVAAANIDKYKLKGRIKLFCGDLFEPILAQSGGKRFDLIVCNPPYVTASEFEALDKNVKDYEPKSALLAGKDGLEVSKKVIEQADKFLKSDAALMLEVGCGQEEPVRELLKSAECFLEVKVEKDFQGIGRVAIARRMKSD